MLELYKHPFNQSLGVDMTKVNPAILERSQSYSIFSDKRLLFTGGFVPQWAGRAEAWAMFAPGNTLSFYTLHKIVRRHLEACPFRRVEATVDLEFENGHRWIRALGFELEAPRLKAYFPDGSDASLYAFLK